MILPACTLYTAVMGADRFDHKACKTTTLDHEITTLPTEMATLTTTAAVAAIYILLLRMLPLNRMAILVVICMCMLTRHSTTKQ